MTKLFIGNGTRQNYELNYRVPGIGENSPMPLRVQRILVGGQILVSGNTDRDLVSFIINQFLIYGICEAKDVDNLKTFVPLCYSIDSPITARQIQTLMEHNSRVLIMKGVENRKQAAVSVNEQIENIINDANRPENLRALEMSVVEENHDERDSTPAVAEGFRVVREVNDRPKSPVHRGRRKAA